MQEPGPEAPNEISASFQSTIGVTWDQFGFQAWLARRGRAAHPGVCTCVYAQVWAQGEGTHNRFE